jgi:hypothetical protein
MHYCTKASQSNPPPIHDPVPELQKLLGSPVVFISWPLGVKATRKKWGHLTVEKMSKAYLAKLRHGNIGVALGAVSGGLCAIDIDNEAFVDPFLRANPWTSQTLQTHGQRGRVFWVRCTGKYPGSSFFKTDGGEAVGEFRATGNQSIVWGVHPATKKPYQRICTAPAFPIDYNAICWPAGVVPPTLQRGGVDELKSRGVDDAVSVSLPSLVPGSFPVNLVQCTNGVLLPDVLRARVDSCLPARGQNTQLLFKLARHLKFADGITNQLLTAAFDLWYARGEALGHLRQDETKDDYAGKFWLAVENAKTPPQIFESAVKRARSAPLPPEADLFVSDAAKLITAICYQLHLQTPEGESWYLPCRKGDGAVGIHWTGVAGYLARLRAAGVIEVAGPPRMAVNPNERRAARHVWKGFTTPQGIF